MGRWSWSGRGVIEETGRFTIDDLKTWGFISKDPGLKTGIITISRDGKKTGNLGIEVHIERDWSYIKFDYLLDKKPVSYEHEIELFPLHFGGHRFYFRCRHCRRRVMALYLSGGYYACRHCQRLAYEVSQKHRAPLENLNRALRLERRAEELRKYRHPRKANRLLWRAYKFNRLGLMDLQVRYGIRGR